MSIERAMLVVAGLLALSVLASRASARAGVPALALFIAIGMLAGSESIGGIYFDDAHLSQAVGVVALAFILFAGGLDTDWGRIRPVIGQGLSLATVGVGLTMLLVGVFCAMLIGLTLLEGLLLGAVMASTDAAAVFSVLRSGGARLKGNLREMIEFESGSNDAMAVFLTVGLIQLITVPGTSPLSLVSLFVLQMSVGGVLGYAFGRGGAWVINRLRLQADGLYVVATVALVLMTFGVTALLGGSGFLAVYVAGLVLGNTSFVHRGSVTRFHDGLAWLMQIAMFLTLGLLVFPSQLLAVAGAGLLLSAFLIFVARPVSVFASLFWARMSIRELAFVSWVGLRGATPIILATFPVVAGVAKANTLFNLVFFVVLTSVVIQGTTVPFVARRLGLQTHEPAAKPSPVSLSDNVSASVVNVVVGPDSPAAGMRVVDLHLPQRVLVVLIERNGEHIVPTGTTLLEAGDHITLVANETDLAQMRGLMS